MSSIASSSSSTTSRYGGTQTDYLKRSSEAIGKGLIEISGARNQGKDLGEVFFSLLDSLAKSRRKIAEEHETKDAWLFGRSRLYCDDDVAFTGIGEKYNLGAPYKAYNNKMLSLFQKIIIGTIPLREEPSRKKFRMDEECEGRKCSFELELVTIKELTERKWGIIDPKDWVEAMQKLQIKPNPEIARMSEKNFPATESDRALLEEFHFNQQKLKKEYPALYVRAKMNFMLKSLDRTFPPPNKVFHPDGTLSHVEGDSSNLKNIYLLAKVRIEINGKMYALSEYLTWTYQDYRTDPTLRLSRSSIVIIHQDKYLIDPTLQEVSKLFKKALQWESSQGDVEELKTQVALIRYLFAHAMPYRRGSAAIGEWLEEIIYRDRGLHFRRIEGKSGDLEAFIAPLWSSYLPEYNKTISVT